MKKTLRALLGALILPVVLLCVSALQGCEKSNEMGKLRGQWQLLTIEYPDGEVVTVDNPRRYIVFDQWIVQLTSTDDDTMFTGYWTGTVTGTDPDYVFDFPYDKDESNLERIAPWGIDDWHVAVHVSTLDSKRLVMKAGDNTLTLRRF